MAICVVCATKFYPATWWEPAEDCACGANWSAQAVETDEDRERVRELEAVWQVECDAQTLADRVLTGANLALGWRAAGYASAEDCAAALCGDGETVAVRERAREIVAEQLGHVER